MMDTKILKISHICSQYYLLFSDTILTSSYTNTRFKIILLISVFISKIRFTNAYIKVISLRLHRSMESVIPFTMTE